jgi:exopolysaccharide biosynthesis polyprenyl glycosylphosphotransferase
MHRVVDGVIVCLPIKSRYEEIQQALATCARVGVPAKYPADLFRSGLGVSFSDGSAATRVFYVAVAPNDYRLLIKRAMDVLGAAALLVLLSPLILAVALVVKLTSPGPVFFTQERYGYMKRRFRMLKFRTMVDGAEQMQADLEHRNEASGPVFKIRDDPRVTGIGRFLRRSSLDELPQLWHVLTGEMSLVGPRPMAVRDVGLFPEPWLMRRFSVPPGVTCLWQISGRSGVGFDRWIALDLEYIDRWTLWLDLRILAGTVPAVLRGAGAM